MIHKIDSNPIFIIGTQRSGTTLLRLILNAHSKVAIPEESTFLIPLLKRKNIKKTFKGKKQEAILDYLQNNEQLMLWNFESNKTIEKLKKRDDISLKEIFIELFTSYCEYEGKIQWGDKSPSFFRKIAILHELFPNAKFVHIVRDGRDVFNSWRKIDPSKSNIAVVAIEWNYKLSKIEKALTKIPSDKWITIRYEDLIEKSAEIMKLICNFIEIEFEENMLGFYKVSKKYIGTHHSKLIFKPIDPENKFKWKRCLAQTEINVFNLISGYFLRKYGYEVYPNSKKMRTLLHAIKLIIFGLPSRFIQFYTISKLSETALKKGTGIGKNKVGILPEK